ncbi:MAG: sensor histidine kinase [Christensenellales bacterium]
MIPFVDCNEIAFRGAFIVLALAASVGVVCFAISLSYRLRLRYILPGLLCTIGAILTFCFLTDGIRIRDLGENRNDFSGSICLLPTWSVVLIALFLLACIGICLALVIKKRLSSLTAMSVKEAISVLPAGVCFYDETGRLLLVNEQISNECGQITGMPLLDGAAFWSAMCEGKVADGVVCSVEGDSVLVEKNDGRASCYKRIAHILNGKTVYEISGSDISREFALKRKVEKQNEELRKMNFRLRKYGETVTEVTKERETLAARVKVHDGMGSLILKTKRALLQGECDKEALINEWNGIVSLIYAPEIEGDRFAEIEKTAESVGVKIVYDGVRPKAGGEEEKILLSAVFECLTNTARHADGNELYVTFCDDGKFICANIGNNGRPPQAEIVEGGGLSSLRTMTEMAGGSMKTESSPRFLLTVRVPKEEKEDER